MEIDYEDDDDGYDAENDEELGHTEENKLGYPQESEYNQEDEYGPSEELMEMSCLDDEFSRFRDELGYDEDEDEDENDEFDQLEDDDDDGDGSDDCDGSDDGEKNGDMGGAGCITGARSLSRYDIGQNSRQCPRCHHLNAERQDSLVEQERKARCLLCGTPLHPQGIFAKLLREGLI